ncbi:MAG TPA: tetraacyldisaccharide 4'-kinase, partial [Gammaproteobacteria bacterium]|nr:tetraacyldisaccharide 4'-kinase [Gammaproteobacteria bacterium]
MTKVIQILETIWYQDKKPPLILIGLSKIYGFLFKIRKALFSLGILSSTKPDIPVIVIGNLNIGGTGKTPFTLYLANALARSGKKVGIVTRGYMGRKSSSTPLILEED